jgi:SCY1-like protein 1
MGNSASALPYAIGKQVSTVNDGWALHEGSRKSDSATVTVFVAKKPALSKAPLDQRNPSLTRLDPALHHFQNCKKLRHPHILKVFATLDTDNPNDASLGHSAATSVSSAAASATTGDLIVVTEPCISLDSWLQTGPSSDQIAWGLESIVRALHFLHASASLAHGNVSPTSFYVTPAGDVKLWDFSLVTAISPDQGGVPHHFRDCEAIITPAPYRSPERQQGQWNVIAENGIHAMDSYSLGVLMGHFYKGRLPPQFTKAVQRLLTANVKMRPRVQPLLKCPVFDTPYQKLQLQVEELSVQPVEQKVVFWQNLASKLEAGGIPESVGVYKLLPIMKSSIETICNTESLRTQSMYRREGTFVESVSNNRVQYYSRACSFTVHRRYICARARLQLTDHSTLPVALL